MNKYILMGLIFSYLILATLLADSLAISSTVEIIEGMDIPQKATGLKAVIDLLSTFWKILTFQINIPALATVIFFYPPTIMVVFMMIDIIKDLIPLT